MVARSARRPRGARALSTAVAVMLAASACGGGRGPQAPAPVVVDVSRAGEAAAAIQSPTPPPAPTPAATPLPPDARPRVPEAQSLEAFAAPAPYRQGDTRSETLVRRTDGWATDWSVHSIGYDELLSGGVARDGIPALDDPAYESIEAADAWLSPRDPVIAVFMGGAARAYPLQVLTWHEIANDELAGTPVAVTYCPLCNAALAFDRRAHGEVLDFGVTGLLRHSDLVMYDRQTESLWQQLEGTAIAGHLTGTSLDLVPSLLVSWADFKATFPRGDVLSRATGRVRSYGVNPYEGYDTGAPFMFLGKPDPRLRPTERVVAVEEAGMAAAYPFEALATAGAVNDVVGGLPIAVLWKPGTASALDEALIARSRDVGSAGVFDRRVARLSGPTSAAAGVKALTFSAEGDGRFRDEETGSVWSIFGHAEEGPLTGAEMPVVSHGNHFWFAWAAFRPETRVWGVDAATH